MPDLQEMEPAVAASTTSLPVLQGEKQGLRLTGWTKESWRLREINGQVSDEGAVTIDWVTTRRDLP